jgi:hypothetical protein
MPRDHAEPDTHLVAEGHRQGVLQVGAARHHRVAVFGGEGSKGGLERREVGVDQGQRVPHLEHGGRIHDVLGGCAPVDVAARFPALFGELMHDADDRVADEVGFGLELFHVDGIGARQLFDHPGSVLWDDADARLGGCQRHLDLYVATDHRLVAEDAPHGGCAEGIAEDGGIEDGGGHGRCAWA